MVAKGASDASSSHTHQGHLAPLFFTAGSLTAARLVRKKLDVDMRMAALPVFAVPWAQP